MVKKRPLNLFPNGYNDENLLKPGKFKTINKLILYRNQ